MVQLPPGVERYQDIWDPANPAMLMPAEIFWQDHQKWLESVGYMLRPRYRPGWVPSWKGPNIIRYDFEDGQSLRYRQLMDATRISDGAMVALKTVEANVHPYEIEIAKFLSSEPLRSDPRNHCVPVYDVIRVPDTADTFLLVMPFLRRYDSPKFDTIGECIDFFTQIFEGLQFMHDHLVAHRDCCDNNIMMDPTAMYPKLFHPASSDKNLDFSGTAKHYTRTERPPRYLLIDFGLSRRYLSKDRPILEDPIRGGDKSVPEFQAYDDPCDPFPTDVYYIGNLIREEFIQRHFGFDFMQSLVEAMVHVEPAKRPTMNEVVARFDSICRTMSTTQLRARVARRNELSIVSGWRNMVHVARCCYYSLRRLPPSSSLQ
ncbi:hypothetical protein BD410DRAFT_796205 [Rickenella mellea]|uniref:Protein kinase domain-containing protein n=1 Tax=Rickenella mellea TaxID=50990 RepID=A0A4Y7PKU0_9AGAM|nr:hypothetical protein BD410DRAFT_796205 [Rickenella mellea]